MVYLIAAQVARAAVIWTANKTARKVLKTAAIGFVAVYLVKRHQSIKEREEKNKTDFN